MRPIEIYPYKDSRVLALSEGSDNTLFMVDGERLGKWSVMVDTMLDEYDELLHIHSDQLYALSDLLKLQAKQITTLTEKLAEQYKRNAELDSHVQKLTQVIEEHFCHGLPSDTGLYWGDDTDDDEDE